MTNSESERKNLEKLVQDIPVISLDVPVPERPCTKKRAYKARKKAKAHIEPRTSNGQTYYWYRRGTDKPIYLGSAETILKAVTGQKEVRK